MKRGDLINGFQYLILLVIARRGSVGAGEIRSQLAAFLGDDLTPGGVGSTLKVLEDNGQISRTRARAAGRVGVGGGHVVYHCSLTHAGAERLAFMNRAVRALLPPEGEGDDNGKTPGTP